MQPSSILNSKVFKDELQNQKQKMLKIEDFKRSRISNELTHLQKTMSPEYQALLFRAKKQRQGMAVIDTEVEQFKKEFTEVKQQIFEKFSGVTENEA